MGDADNNGVCGDCGAGECNWMSVNRGLYLCNECSFVHRSLGPQFSRVKSIKHSRWNATERKLVTTLAVGPANNVWEHLLRYPGKGVEVMKKPGTGDSIDVKTRFITAKHGQFQFVLKRKSGDWEERNEELHSTVRTADVGTALRLIATGADPNFFHPERGTRPLHVACKSGQVLQVELLFLHGAQVDAPDYLGQTAAEHAVAAGFKDLAKRVEELRYHLTDRLSYFVSGELPDHSEGKHLIIPVGPTNSAGQEESIKRLPPYVLEQLAADLYDEVDRREIEKLMIQQVNDHSKLSLAFLPINSNFPSVRNQTRQKFARLTEMEFSALITLVLKESKRRHMEGSSSLDVDKDIFLVTASSPVIVKPTGIAEDDDEFPLYDSVASDDDVVMSEVKTAETHTNPAPLEMDVRNSNINSAAAHPSRNTTESSFIARLAEERISELERSNLALKYEVKLMQQMLGNFIRDNLGNRKVKTVQLTEMDRINSNSLGSPTNSSGELKENSVSSSSLSGVVLRRSSSGLENLKKTRSVSMYTTEKVDFSTGSSKSLDKGERDENEKISPYDYVQSNTRNIVELIKILIEYAQTSDYDGVRLTAGKMYDAATRMSSVLMGQSSCDDRIIQSLQNVLVQVLRMKTETPLLRNSQLLLAATLSANENSKAFVDGNAAQLYVQKVKQLCFDVGASMKQLVSAVASANFT